MNRYKTLAAMIKAWRTMVEWFVGKGCWHSSFRIGFLHLVVVLSLFLLEDEYGVGGSVIIIADFPIWCASQLFVRLGDSPYESYSRVLTVIGLGTCMWAIIGYYGGRYVHDKRKEASN